MNNWLQNIKGQITELATEVLNDATEEGQVSTTSELQIEKKKSTECERLYLVEKSKCEALEKKLVEMEEQLYSVNIENDAVKEKFMAIVADRDEMIKKLEREMERLKFHQENQEGTFHNIELDTDSTSREEGELSSQISKLKEKHENEISAILSVHNSNVKQLKEDYEKRIEQLETWNTSNLSEQPSAEKDETLLADVNLLKSDIALLKAEIDGKNAEIEEIRQERDNLRQQIEEINEETRRNEKLLLTGSEEFKPSSDSESAASNNADWEKMGKDEIEVEGVSSSTTTTTTSETKDSSTSDGKYLRSERRQRGGVKVEMMEQSIQTEQFTPEEDIQINQLKDEMSHLLEQIGQLKEQISLEEINKGQILLEKEQIIEQELNHLKDVLEELRKNSDEENEKRFEEKEQLKDLLKEKLEKIEGLNFLLEDYKRERSDFNDEIKFLKIEYENKIKEIEEYNCFEKEEIKKKEMDKIEYLELENKRHLKDLSTLTSDNSELKSLLDYEHSECQKYYFKLEEFSKKLELSLNENKNKDEELEIKNGRILKLESELGRLKEHLLGIEEISSKEAIAAEERETELRRQLREFQNKYENDEFTTSKCLLNYQNELEQLKINLQNLKKEKEDLTSNLNEKESSLAETKNALINLQIVLKDLADEQKSEKLRFEGEIKMLRDELKKEKQQLQQFQNKEELIQLTQTTNLDKLNYLESQLKIKNDLIDELENSLEEFRI
uniref:Golgin-84 n=1 Tax=Meloidogyne floridensis TaxID=298350 RepID=A0A915NR28_9BILA